MDNGKKKYNISLLRIFATLAVVMLHTCSTLCDNPERFVLDNSQLVFFNCIFHLMRWSVPVFFMITGSLMLNHQKEVSAKLCIKKYVFRITLALIVFGVPFSIMKIFMETRKLSLSMFGNAFISIFTGNSWKHLWYLYVLIGIYLILPIIKKYTDNTSKKEQVILLIILFIFDFLIPIISEISGIKIALEVPLTYPVFYLLLGFWLANYGNQLLSKKIVLILFIVINCIIISVELLVESYSDLLTGYDSPLTAINAACIFYLFDGVKVKEKNEKFIWSIDRLCFGVYLIHPLFIHLLYKLINVTPLSFFCYPLATLVFWIAFVLLSFSISFVMNKIKPLKLYIL